jgi:hypothetical protein
MNVITAERVSETTSLAALVYLHLLFSRMVPDLDEISDRSGW